MGREKPSHPRRPRRSPNYPTNLWRDVPESCLALCVQIACISDAADEQQLQTARKATHDLVIRQAGTARLSGVSWLEYSLPTAADVLDRLQTDYASAGTLSDADLKTFDGARAYLTQHPAGALIVGSCWADTRVSMAARS